MLTEPPDRSGLGGVQARFDDATPSRPSSLVLRDPVGVIEARNPANVPQAIRDVEAAVSEGRWAAGFISYEAAPGFDPAMAVLTRDTGDPFHQLPLVWFGIFAGAERRGPDAAASEDAPDEPTPALSWSPSIRRAAYEEGVERVRDLIRSGDIYQANYTFRLRAAMEADPRTVYAELCRAQRSSYCASLRAGRYRILSASPELFFRIDGDRVTTRPMKGTATRGRWTAEDDATAEALRASPKDRAENAMIVDLLRSDLGRISRPGSVAFPALFQTERYETVWQMTSTVVSRLATGHRLVDVLRALFPSGSVTGAPKIRAMEVIRDLEDSPRGVYTGAIGYVAPPGTPGPRACFNVAIRTIVVDDARGVAEFGVGGGITWDSTSRGEFAEAIAKTRVLTERRPRFGLIETLAFEPGTGFRRLDAHMDRLRASARYFGFPFDDTEIRRAMEKQGAGIEDDARVRCVLWEDGRLEVEASPMPGRPEGPVSLAIDEQPVDDRDPMLFHKTTLRRAYEEAEARHPEADDVLLVNRRGEITESTIANVAVRLGGRWWTPPLESGLLPGVERAAALATGRVQERVISGRDVRRAEGLALLSSVRGWRPAKLAG